MTYVEMNMVRAGVVNHPKQWAHCGYYELINIRKHYTILDTQSLLQMFSLNNLKDLIEYRRLTVENAIKKIGILLEMKNGQKVLPQEVNLF